MSGSVLMPGWGGGGRCVPGASPHKPGLLHLVLRLGCVAEVLRVPKPLLGSGSLTSWNAGQAQAFPRGPRQPDPCLVMFTGRETHEPDKVVQRQPFSPPSSAQMSEILNISL